MTVVRLLSWPGMPAEGALARAAERARVEVHNEVISSNEALEALMQSHADGYDVVCPSDYMVERLAREGRLQSLDLASRAQWADWVRNPVWDPGLEHCAPLAFGTTGILFRRKELVDADGWSALFAPPPGRAVGMLAEMREVVGAALIASGRNPSDCEPDALAAAWRLLADQQPVVHAYSSDDFVSPVKKGLVSAHHAWSGPAALAVRQDPELGYAVPREGACVWVTTAAIPAAAAEPDAARRLIVALLEPEIAAETVSSNGFATPSETARALLPAEIASNATLFPSDDELGRCTPLRDLGPRGAAMEAVWRRLLARARDRFTDGLVVDVS